MSLIDIRSMLETQLSTLTPKVSTQYENVTFTPVTNVPYQSVNLIMNEPDDPTIGSSGLYREKGFFQITLRYPLGNGTTQAMTQAEAIRHIFAQGTVLTKNGFRLICTRTPYIRVMPNEVDRFVVIVRCSFTVDVYT